MKQQDQGAWSPYLAGALSGLVGVFSVWLTGNFFGTSTSFVRTAGMIEQVFAPERVAQLSYFTKIAPKIDWQWMFVVGIFWGSLIAALTSGSFKLQAVPDMWAVRFGEKSIARRALTAFAGGVVAMFGARLADGCPSGHGLSGSLQLAVSGFIALFFFFLAGMIAARLLYGRGGAK
ncbi:YeeE/YedE thiosulfate transporter family protein [Desulfosoma sp.]|uniref:YeeE/YedE thiosulfate transporter family protein n=1 Tax=Desulfosoma sp. TaxID=2603217 RepID=UPI004049EDCD